jgi:hypothetical protein
MSQQTFEALEHALREHLADEIPGIALTAWMSIAAGVSLDNADPITFYLRSGSNGPLHERIGLLRYATVQAEADILRDDS